MQGEEQYLESYCGVVRDGAAFDSNHLDDSSNTAWLMSAGTGVLYGNGKVYRNGSSAIDSGQILTIEADLDKGTLRFWVAGKSHGPGYTSGVTGRLRFATSVVWKGFAVQIVPTPKLQA